MANNKTEKATPKRQDEARQKGQVARSMDLNGAVVLLAGLFALAATGPHLAAVLREALEDGLTLAAQPSVVNRDGLGALMSGVAIASMLAMAPIVGACAVAGILTNLAQVQWKPSAKAMKPDFKKISPLQGAKNLFGPNAIFEAGKSVSKLAAVGGVAALVLLPRLTELGGLVGIGPDSLGREIARLVLQVAQRAALAYLVIAVVDYFWQRHRHEKGLRMEKEEVKQEHKQQNLPPEVRAMLRRRQMQAARARMMDAVPDADVVVTNPTHFAVALRYDGAAAAPQVVAKGQDILAKRIREKAADAGVPVISDPPLARSLHATVEIGELVPEALYQAIAELLAFVYRTAGRRAHA